MGWLLKVEEHSTEPLCLGPDPQLAHLHQEQAQTGSSPAEWLEHLARGVNLAPLQLSSTAEGEVPRLLHPAAVEKFLLVGRLPSRLERRGPFL